MDPIKCFQECRSGVVQIFLERDHQKSEAALAQVSFAIRFLRKEQKCPKDITRILIILIQSAKMMCMIELYIIICSAQKHLSVKQKIDKRERFLRALLEYADESNTFNPHFHRTEMIQRLRISKVDFNIVQKQLGDRYCRYIDQHKGDARYEICVSEYLALRAQFNHERTLEKRHNQLVRLAILVAIFGPVLAAALALWFQTR